MRTLRAALFAMAALGPSCGGRAPGAGAGRVDASVDPAPRRDDGGGCLAPGSRMESLVHDGRRRAYHLHVPARHDCGAPVALVLGFHGFASRAADQAQVSDMIAKADREGFVAAHPEGIVDPLSGLRSWNAGRCCGSAAQQRIDDVGFVRALIDHLSGRTNLDRRRVFATGMSNGGSFAHRLACEAADRVAAVAPVAGTPVVDACQPSRPVSVLHFHGTADPLVPYQGGGPFAFPPVSDAMDGWAKRDACAATRTQTRREAAATCATFDSCPAGVAVTSCTIEGGGHAWPGGSRSRPGEMSATDAMWDFFAAHPGP